MNFNNLYKSIKNHTDKLRFPDDFDAGEPIVEGDASNNDDIDALDADASGDGNEDINTDKNKDADGLEEIIEEESDLDADGNPIKKEDDKSKDKKDDLSDDEKKTPLIKAINDKFKGIFKEFPEVKTAIFRDKAFREHFASPDEAREAKGLVENFEQIQTEIASGDAESVVKFLSETSKDGKATVKFGRNLIKSLESNPKVYSAILFPTITGILKEAKEVAEHHGNKNLQLSVEHLAAHLFGSKDGSIPEDSIKPDDDNKNGEPSEAEKVLAQKGKEFGEDVLETTFSEQSTLVETSLAASKNIKPALKKSMISEINYQIGLRLKEDKAFGKVMEGHWKNAKAKGFPLAMRSSIKAAYLEGVKKLLPTVRAEVLKENGYIMRKASSKSGDTKDDVSVRKTDSSGKNTNNNSGKGKTKDERLAELKKSGKSDLEILDIIDKEGLT